MFCSRCGKSLMMDDLQCPFCSTPVGESRFEGTLYTSAQMHIKPGMRISYFPAEGDISAEAPAEGGETETASVFTAESEPAPTYTRTSYTSMTEEEKDTGDADSRTIYRPVYEGTSIPGDVLKDMRAAMAKEEEEEEAATMPEELSEEAINSLNSLDEELKMEEMDLSQFRARKIEAVDRAGISAGVTDYIQNLEEKQYRKASRKRRSYDEDMDEAYATPQEEPLYEDDLPVNPDIDTEQPEVFDDIDEEEFDELRYGRVLGVKDVLKIAIIMVVAAALFVAIFLGIRHIRGQQANSSPIEGVTQSLYTEGIAQLKENVASDYVNEMIAVYKDQGILALTTALQEDTNALDALVPAEPAVNDALFVSAVQKIQNNIGNAIMMDANALAMGGGNDVIEASEARWKVVNDSITQLENSKTAAELTAVLNGEQITVTAPSTPTPAPTISYPTLTKGDKSDAVLDLQNRLYALGFLLEDRDGDYGSKTQTAIKLFQDAAGLPVTGIADSATQAALYADDAPRTEYAQITPTPKPTETPAPTPETEGAEAA